MYTLAEIRELIQLLDETSLTELVIERDGEKVSLRKAERLVTAAPIAYSAPIAEMPIPAAAPAAHPQSSGERSTAPSAMDREGHQMIKSPMVGTFYRSSSPGTAAFVEVGTRVNDKTIVCILEAMKVMNEIEADISGEIVEILVENGQLVEYGQPLFLVKVD